MVRFVDLVSSWTLFIIPPPCSPSTVNAPFPSSTALLVAPYCSRLDSLATSTQIGRAHV